MLRSSLSATIDLKLLVGSCFIIPRFCMVWAFFLSCCIIRYSCLYRPNARAYSVRFICLRSKICLISTECPAYALVLEDLATWPIDFRSVVSSSIIAVSCCLIACSDSYYSSLSSMLTSFLNLCLIFWFLELKTSSKSLKILNLVFSLIVILYVFSRCGM